MKPYHAYLDLLVDRFDELRYRVENQFADALATLASMIEIPAGMTMQPLLIETGSAPAYFCLIGNIEDQVELPWYHDIHQFLAYGAYPELAILASVIEIHAGMTMRPLLIKTRFAPAYYCLIGDIED